MLKDLLSQEKYLQLNQEDTQLLLLWNRNFFSHTIDPDQELPIPFSEKATLTITTLFLEIFINEFYKIIWQPRCNLITEWECTKGIKKQDLRKKIPAHQHITYERTLTQQIEGDTYDLKGRKILKHSEQWSIALGKTRQYIDQLIIEGEFYIGDDRVQEQSIGWGTGSEF
ncbi:unnamed protein product [Rhizophagus irregularis]|nr:unnamed protein product [Rhizophagus irregularis]CAB5203021.1 unnamed protein product [Rhizophagus irregularis]